MRLISVIFFIIAATMVAAECHAQKTGVRGSIVADDGNALSYATIYVKQLGSGTTSNENGNFDIPLSPGNYDLVFQHLGRKTEVRNVQVKDGYITLKISMVPQDIILKEVTIGSDDEDPAYTIMRKAIAKANYHRNVVDQYTARVYIKGTAKLKDYPWLAKKALEKDGIEKGRVYLSESLSEIRFTRPNKFEQKVISVRSDRKENANPGSYIFGSFYEPEIAETVTPLSPKAFSYYRFEYMGTFRDRDYEISRIRVIPRSRGDNVVDGMIYIVEDWWAIHTLDIHTSKLGIDFQIKVTFAPIEDKVWLPVSHQFKVDDEVLGFEFEAHYLSAVSDYKIKLNPAIYVEKMAVVDESVEKARAKEVEKKQLASGKPKKSDKGDLQARLAAGEEITRKELKSIIREYEKQERKEMKEPEVISDFTFDDDSTAYKNDSVYWADIRPVPLTTEEIKGYQKADSIAAIERAKEQGDTLKESKHKGFQPWDLLLGDSYKIAKHSNFRIYTPMGGFNTVEGWNLIYKIAFGTILQDTNRTRFRITPVFRYAFARSMPSGYLNVMTGNRRFRLELEGGRYVQQFNSEMPILPLVNTFTTLFLEENLMKLYEQEYVNLRFRRVFNYRWTINSTLAWSYRMPLVNRSDFQLVNRRGTEGYTSNEPVNVESSTAFDKHEAYIGAFGFSARPWVKLRSHNGRKYPVHGSSPTLTVDYRKGFGGSVDFDYLQAGARHGFDIGARGSVDLSVSAGTFLNDRRMFFMDYKHFLGNRTPFSTTDPIGSFRLLDYYQYSTSDRFFTASIHYQFRKFLVTTIPHVRLAGIRENIFFSYLRTPSSPEYVEAGYSIDGILRVFRLEAAISFDDWAQRDYGFRVGIATSIAANFVD